MGRRAYFDHRPWLAALAVVSCLAGAARAHHGTSGGRVVPRAPTAARVHGQVPPPRLDLALAYDLTVFDRVLDGQTAYDRRAYGAVTLHLATLSVAATLPHGTRASLSVPVGLLTISPPDGPAEHTAGLADLRVDLGQDVWALLGPPSRFRLVVTAGAVAPTGRADAGAGLSVTDVTPGSDGALNVSTSNTHASLGAGTWSLTGGVEAGYAARVLDVRLAASGVVPVAETDDGTRWGADLGVEAGARVPFLADRLAARLGADYHRHLDDSVISAEGGRVNIGGRDEVGVFAGLDIRLRPGVDCGVGAHVPVWQSVDGVQLVETAGARLACTVALPL
jgi:hypothetical protein